MSSSAVSEQTVALGADSGSRPKLIATMSSSACHLTLRLGLAETAPGEGVVVVGGHHVGASRGGVRSWPPLPEDLGFVGEPELQRGERPKSGAQGSEISDVRLLQRPPDPSRLSLSLSVRRQRKRIREPRPTSGEHPSDRRCGARKSETQNRARLGLGRMLAPYLRDICRGKRCWEFRAGSRHTENRLSRNSSHTWRQLSPKFEP